jgi:hypothetical protein
MVVVGSAYCSLITPCSLAHLLIAQAAVFFRGFSTKMEMVYHLLVDVYSSDRQIVRARLLLGGSYTYLIYCIILYGLGMPWPRTYWLLCGVRTFISLSYSYSTFQTRRYQVLRNDQPYSSSLGNDQWPRSRDEEEWKIEKLLTLLLPRRWPLLSRLSVEFRCPTYFWQTWYISWVWSSLYLLRTYHNCK